jgi:hypothetical protein
MLVRLTVAMVVLGASLAEANPLTSGDSAEVQPGETETATSGCPLERPATLGGFSAQFGPAGGAEVTGFKMNRNGWRLLAANTGGEKRLFGVESYCSPGGSQARFQVRTSTMEIEPLARARVVARCRAGETLLAGGFRSSIDPATRGRHVVVNGMHRVGVRALQVGAVNISKARSGIATAYAYCGHGRRPVVSLQTVEVEPGRSERLVSSCPGEHRGEFRGVFIGFQGSGLDRGSVVTPGQMRFFAPDKVVVTGVNRSEDEAGEMTAYIYCRPAGAP